MKDFESWHVLKQKLNSKDSVPFFKEREIWWCSLGVNIGHEEDGKNAEFSRPVLIVTKFNRRLFWGVPLTTKIKNTAHYFQFIFRDKTQCAMLTQIRLLDANRLTRRMGRINQNSFNDVAQQLTLYLKK